MLNLPIFSKFDVEVRKFFAISNAAKNSRVVP